MEGKELYHNDDEELDPKSKKEKEQEEADADEFGLPEIDEPEEKPEDLGDPYPESWEENKEETFAYDEPSEDSIESTEEEVEPDYTYDEGDTSEDEDEEEYRSSYYEEEYGQKKFPVGWIIFAVFVLIAIIIAVFWWLNRDEPQPVQQTQTTIEQPVVREPEPEPEPVIEEPAPEPEPVRQAGVFEINAPTGRYHVIVASSIDKDLVRDYGNKLAKQGMTCNILAPRGNKKFHRLSVADFVSLNDAAIRSEELKHTLGEDVWVIRY